MRKLCLGALSLVLCASQTNMAAAFAVDQPAAAVRGLRPVIACFGDSLTAGLGLDAAQTYPVLLQHDLDAHGYRYRVVNMGVSGDTTQDGLERMRMVLAEKPAVVILEFGANDGLRGQPISHIESNLGKMIEAFQKAGAQVLLAGITLPPNYGAEYIHRFDAMYRTLAAKYKAQLIPFLLVNVAAHANLMQHDGLHPNAAGERIVTETIWKALQPMLKR